MRKLTDRLKYDILEDMEVIYMVRSEVLINGNLLLLVI